MYSGDHMGETDRAYMWWLAGDPAADFTPRKGVMLRKEQLAPGNELDAVSCMGKSDPTRLCCVWPVEYCMRSSFLASSPWRSFRIMPF